MSPRSRQSGVALITALLITAIATVAAAAMASRQQLDIRRTANVVESDQAYLFTLGVESWAGEILARDRRDNQTDHPEEDWATILPPIEVEGGLVAGRIEDMQGRFNLNNLIDGDGAASEEDIRRFRALLAALGLDEALAAAVVDWMDEDVEPRFPAGAEDDYYLRLEPAYRTSNAPMAGPSELLLVRGITPEAYGKLAPHVQALPERTTINVNTATVPVLRSLIEDLTAAEAEQLVEDRGDKGYESVEEFLEHPLLKDRQRPVGGIGVTSRYFLVTADARFGRNTTRLGSLLARRSDGRVQVVMRSQGAL